MDLLACASCAIRDMSRCFSSHLFDSNLELTCSPTLSSFFLISQDLIRLIFVQCIAYLFLLFAVYFVLFNRICQS